MATPREHIEKIRKNKFSIGKEPNPLTEDLHQSVKIFSAELYSKDVHFLMELLQNAEDNEYAEGVDPSLEFIVTSRDITSTGASSTLLIFNNERGFSPNNIDSICSVGRSTKKGNRKRGYIGEKGIGFKSVFLITARPYIFSAGYMIRFDEEPCPECNIGYIVPEWVEENPIVPNIRSIYGSAASLPTTTLVLPLKPDKVLPVKKELSSIHPEILLFLSKIKNFSVKEDNEDPKLSTLSAIAISSETDFVTRKNVNAESYTVHLSTGENVKEFDSECRYYMWRQRFPVKQENRVERRMEVEEWNITLAFPYGPRLELRSNPNSPGIFAYLPTEMMTNFPFIIQADFVLASSRETFLVDNKWNQGILECVPSAFMNAFSSLVKETEDCPVFNLPNIFGFLPVDCSSYPQLDSVRGTIKEMIADESIVPCESDTTQKVFHKPRQVGRLMPRFWDILVKARQQGVSLDSLSSHGNYILNSSFDKSKYNKVLDFMGVKHVENEWYEKCISSSNLVLGVSEGVYIDLLIFLAENWSSWFQNTAIRSIPLLKYADSNSTVRLCSVNHVKQSNIQVLMSKASRHISWLVKWNQEFRFPYGLVFMPISTQDEIFSSYHREMILNWLANNANVICVDVKGYANRLSSSLSFDSKVAISYTHFLYHSLSKYFLTEMEVKNFCNRMPLVDNYGSLATQRNGVLVPASGSKWTKLLGSNPWRREGYVELSEKYLHPGHFAGLSTADRGLTSFLNHHVGASDIPYLNPPNTDIPLSSPVTKENAFLVLGWIRQIRQSMPSLFLSSIKRRSWLMVSLRGSQSYKPPSESFLVTSSWGNLLQDNSVLVDIPLIDEEFYGREIHEFTGELRAIGVKCGFGEACEYMGEHVMSLASSSALNRSNAFSILRFIRFLREKGLPFSDFICSLKKGKWLLTSLHYKSPEGLVLFDEEWRAAAHISDIPFIDSDYYGKEISSFKSELQLLGVVIGFNENYQLVTQYLKSSAYINPLTAEAFLLMLRCIRHTQYLKSSAYIHPFTAQVKSSDNFFWWLKCSKCIKTDSGYQAPSECFLFNLEWGGLMQVFKGFPLIDQELYGKGIETFKPELKQIGVVVEFEEACMRFSEVFQRHATSHSITKEHVMSFLTCYRKLEEKRRFPPDLMNKVRESPWLRTRLANFMRPNDCILFGPDWEAISKISRLPFIDDGENWYGSDIHKFKTELKRIGVVVDLKDGVNIVASRLCLPQNRSTIAPTSVQSLLECIRLLRHQRVNSTFKSFLNVYTDWVKTHLGYLPPDKTMLFDDQWGKFLQKQDGPFIDEEFYGFNISSYKQELQSIGVVVNLAAGSSLLAGCLGVHSEFNRIVRIYEYLDHFNWKPEGGLRQKVWIPNGGDKGEWVNSEECLLCDKDGLFGQQLHILDRHYKHPLLSFFVRSYQVRSSPSVHDYSKLWKVWQSSAGQKLSSVNCCAFWEQVAREWTLWDPKTRKTMADSLMKLPTDSGSGEILLCNKDDVFIGDDLLLKDLFQACSERPIFVWYPRPSLASLPLTKLLDIYLGIGVRAISESVVKKEVPVMEGAELKSVDNVGSLLRKGLFKLILGFLAGSEVRMEVEKRLEVAKRLLSLEVFETVEPISVSYSLALSSGEVITVEASRMVCWDRERSKLFVQKVERSVPVNTIVFATYFSEVISEGLLWDMEDHICGLSELIKLGFLVSFDEKAVGFLMKKKNLHVEEEEEAAFLSSIPSALIPSPLVVPLVMVVSAILIFILFPAIF